MLLFIASKKICLCWLFVSTKITKTVSVTQSIWRNFGWWAVRNWHPRNFVKHCVLLCFFLKDNSAQMFMWRSNLWLLLFNLSPDPLACPNHEVVVLQPLAGDTPGLESIDILKNYYIAPLRHLFQPRYGTFVPPSTYILPPPHLSPFYAASSLSIVPASPS